MRDAIHSARKISVAYIDEQHRRTKRTIWPIAMAYYVDVTVIAAWCELRQDFRHFRADRIVSARFLDDHFTSESVRLTTQWLALNQKRREIWAQNRMVAKAEPLGSDRPAMHLRH